MALPALHTRLPAALAEVTSKLSINLRYAESYEENDKVRASKTSSIENSPTFPFTAEAAAAVRSPGIILVPNVAGYRFSPKLTFNPKAATLSHDPATESVYRRSTFYR